MDISISNSKKMLGAVFVVLLFLLTLYITYSDNEKKLVEEYILNSDEIKNNVGEIIDFDLTKIRKVGLDSKDFKYKKYFYRVVGKRSKENIVIKLTVTDSALKKYKFEILNKDI